jgi:hypothetical protein
MLWSYANAVALFISAQSSSNAEISLDGTICSICTTSLPVVGLPDVILPAGTAGVLTEDQTCAVTEQMAQSGLFTPEQCVLLGASNVPSNCGCAASERQIAASTETPTMAPVDAPTEMTRITVTGSVSIRLTPARYDLEGSNAMHFLNQCAVFYLEQLQAINVTCAISGIGNVINSQIVLSTNVTSIFATGTVIEDYDQALIDAIQHNSSRFLFLLQRRGTSGTMTYFSDVSKVDVVIPTAAPTPASRTTEPIVLNPTDAPTQSDIRVTTTTPVAASETSGGLSIGVLLGAIALGIVCVAVIGYLVMHRRKRKSRCPPTGAGPPTASMVSSATPLVSAIPLDPSVAQPPNVTYKDQVRDAIPMAAASVQPPHLTYKDQAREHPDAVAVPEALAVPADPDALHPNKT